MAQTLPKTLSPQWREQFVLELLEETGDVLEATVWDHDNGLRDDFIGRRVQTFPSWESRRILKNLSQQCIEMRASVLSVNKTLT